MSTLSRGEGGHFRNYCLTGLILIFLLILLLIGFVTREPELGNSASQHSILQGQAMQKRWLWWAAITVVLVVLAGVGRWLFFSQSTVSNERLVKNEKAFSSLETSDQVRREYVLEVIGLGVTLDKYRQGKLWEALQEGSPYVTIREQDPEKYPWGEQDKDGQGGDRAMDALENGVKTTPMYWGVPSFYAGGPDADPANQPSANDPAGGLVGGADTSGMAFHLFSLGTWKLAERPDLLVGDVFSFFDKHPDVPYVVVSVNDDMGARDRDRPPGTPRLLRTGHYIPEMPDATAVFVLARRERIDSMRPFVWDDPNNEFVHTKLGRMYFRLERNVSRPERKQAGLTPAQIGASLDEDPNKRELPRQPTVTEWLEATTAFAQRPDIRGTGITGTLVSMNPFDSRPPRDWKPTPWFPIPWNREQLDTFDRLPTLGYLHRPVFVKMTDENGQPLTRRTDREKALQDGWQQALQTLPEAQRPKAPARIIAATHNNTEQLIALHSLLNQQAQAGHPEIDTGKSSQFIDTDKRLGNTGAATWFVQMAIGVMGSYRDGGISAAVNLRDPAEASIIFISPPPEEKRKNQQHAIGGDVFRHSVTPAIDPANYAQPQQ